MDEELERLRQKRLKELQAAAPAQTQPSSGGPPPGGVVAGDDTTLPELVRAADLVLVDCYADWCAPCRIFAPTFAAAAKEYAGRATFVKLDTDANPKTAGAFRIMSIPTLLVFRKGKLVKQQAGALPPQMLKALIESQLAAA